jgi:hypothetical protein
LDNNVTKKLTASADLFSSFGRKIIWAGHVSRMGEGTGACRVFVWKTKEKRPLGRPRSRWDDNIKMGLKELG